MAQTEPLTTELKAEESAAIERVVLSDARVRRIIGPGEPRLITTLLEPDKAETDAFLEGKTQTPPRRHIEVVIYNARENRAAQVVFSLSQSRVLSVDRIAAADVPFTQDDAQEALVLAKQNAAVRQAVGDALERYEIVPSGSDATIAFAVQMLPLRSIAPKDPCRVDRCAELIFRTEDGYLPLRVRVDLTRGTVELVRGRENQHK